MKKNKQVLIDQQKQLLDRIEMQNQLILNVEKEIYENINQVLCLARINLSNLDFSDKSRTGEILEQTGNLIAKAISDLRNLAKQAGKL